MSEVKYLKLVMSRTSRELNAEICLCFARSFLSHSFALAAIGSDKPNKFVPFMGQRAYSTTIQTKTAKEWDVDQVDIHRFPIASF